MTPATSKPIEAPLQKIAEAITAKNSDFTVLAARQFGYSLRQSRVELTIEETRPFNVLEEFIIRAAIEFTPSPTVTELAGILGLDPVFVKSTTANLQKLNTLEIKSKLTITETGRNYYSQSSVPQPPYTSQIYAVADPLNNKITFHPEPLNNVLHNVPDLEEFVTIDRTSVDVATLPLDKLLPSLTTHLPEAEKIVTACREVATAEVTWKTISIFVIFDVLEVGLKFQVRSGKQILEAASNWLETLHGEDKISLSSLFTLSNEAIAQECAEILARK